LIAAGNPCPGSQQLDLLSVQDRIRVGHVFVTLFGEKIRTDPARTLVISSDVDSGDMHLERIIDPLLNPGGLPISRFLSIDQRCGAEQKKQYSDELPHRKPP
jgi:hypothetical protein